MSKVDGFFSNGIFIPTPKTIEVRADKLDELFTLLGEENLARAGMNPFLAAIEKDILEAGYVESRGPRPWCEEGAKSPGDGSGRLKALSNIAKRLPDLWGKVKVKIDVYPPLTLEQRSELIDRASKTTAPFTEWDYYKKSMLTWLANPDDTYLQHLERMGIEFAMCFFTPAPEQCLVRTRNAAGKIIKTELKKGLKDDDLWGKGAGGQKQQPVQFGKDLSQAHPRAVQAFFDGAGDDLEHALSYLELVQSVKDWKADKKLRPDLAHPPAALDRIAKEFPESQLVNGVLGKRLAEGRQIGGGREKGKGRMTGKDVEQLGNTHNYSRLVPIILETVERTPGYIGEPHVRRCEKLFKAVETLISVDFSTEAGIAEARQAQVDAVAAIREIHNSAAAEASELQRKVAEKAMAEATKK